MNAASVVEVRTATADDLDPIVRLTQARRAAFARWEPLYWNPRAGIDDHHPFFLKWCIEQNPNCDVKVAVENDIVVGCLFAHHRPDHVFLDDLCVDEGRWLDVGTSLIQSSSGRNRRICAPAKDTSLHTWLQSSEFVCVSTFWALRTPSPSPTPQKLEYRPLPPVLVEPSAHTFGQFDAATEGGLRISTEDGYAIGSAPINPPPYDPGGPTTVVDRVSGPNRASVMATVLREAGNRGDAHVIVVVDQQDQELAEILLNAGATQPVNLWQVS
jgi:hypothetical protein